MRVVILYNSCWYVFLLRRNLIASLLSAGHEVTVVAPRDGYSERVMQLGVAFAPITMTRSGTAIMGELSTLTQIHATLKDHAPDVVLSFTVKCNLYAGLCRRLLPFLHVANVSGLGQLFDSGGTLRYVVHSMYRACLARTDRIFFQNQEDMNYVTGHNLVETSRCSRIPGSGVDLAHFTPVTQPASERRAFLMFGRLLPKKGFYHFLDAATELKARYGDRIAFWILGAPDSERADSAALLVRIMDAHARGIVRYLQSTDDPLPYIREADAVVLPSTYNEGVPRSLLEALACGKPIVTTDWKGCRETVEHGENGYLVTPDSTESLVSALADLSSCDSSKLVAFGRRSRQIAEERFDERLVIEAYHHALCQAEGQGERDTSAGVQHPFDTIRHDSVMSGSTPHVYQGAPQQAS